MAIPKIIHQTVGDKRNLHPAFKKNVAHLRRVNGGWEYRLYDDDDIRIFLREHYEADTLKSWERINPRYGPARADFFRYLLLHKIGGVYLDIKSVAERPLDSVLLADDTYILSHWNEHHAGWGKWPELGVTKEYQQWHIIAAPAHPFLGAVIAHVRLNINRYDARRDGVGKLGVLRVTGPIAYTRAISSIRGLHPHRLVDIEDLGFRFSTVASPENPLAHENYFKRHYQASAEPIILPWRNDPCPCGSGLKFKQCHGRV